MAHATRSSPALRGMHWVPFHQLEKNVYQRSLWFSIFQPGASCRRACVVYGDAGRDISSYFKEKIQCNAVAAVCALPEDSKHANKRREHNNSTQSGEGWDCLLIPKKCYGIMYICAGRLRLSPMRSRTYLRRGRQLRQRIVHHVELIWLSYHVFYYIVIHDIRLARSMNSSKWQVFHPRLFWHIQNAVQ